MEYPKLNPLSSKQTEYMIDEVNRLNQEAHQYLRMPHLILHVAILIFPLLIAEAWEGTSSDFIFLIAPLVLGLLTLYNLNISAEAAGIALIRDRLSERINKTIKQPTYLSRTLGKVRHNSKGTVVAYVLAILIVFITMLAGIVHAQSRIESHHLPWWWLWLQMGTTIFSIVAISIGVLDLSDTRKNLNKILDGIFGKSSRSH